MQPWLIHGAATAGRISIGLLGSICIYLALFIYEDRRGHWQNRIDDLWVEIYDRSRVTKSKTTALFNKVGEKITRVSIDIFGKRLFSLRSVIASVDLSVACSSLFMLTSHLTNYVWRTPPPGAMPDTVRHPSHTAISFLVYMSGGIFPAIVKKQWSPLVPFGVFAYYAFSLFHLPLSYAPLGLYPRFEFIAALAFSFLCDIVVIAVIRKALARSASEISLKRIAVLVLSIAGAAIFSELTPAIVLVIVSRFAPFMAGTFFSAGLVAMMLNTSSIAYCLLNVAFLVFVVAHKIFWPALSRLIYPLAQDKILQHRRLLMCAGSVLLIFAFNFEDVAIKLFVKLLGG